ncbi:serine protease MucD family protein [Leptospira yanagawae serovar Saopaulo str. Sao Paulo = ATCC 700523]|uniref:PDZ domain-containing protein n=3 Tax=Leptospiraceae TaxID=170 RepID=A0ABY2M8Z7_9LEPT|nr:serine protease MucD family protein [Leptospira yanagawae serovar Saopaulo str. Sao Paulo = ATCC 700523]TGL24530.1 PDZ domain-containing protein [Leptospira yanagawae]TGM01597.1 PDZ domain-containing protein [Leptospira jelokensis]
MSMTEKKTNPLRYIAVAFSFLLLGTFLSPILTCGNSSENPLQLKADGSDKLSPAQTQAVALEDAFQEVFDKVSPSVVSIATEGTVNVPLHPFEYFFGPPQNQRKGSRQQRLSGLGSGIVLNEDGYIMTNHHVVENMDKFTVKLKNKSEYGAKLIGSDPTADIALLKISAPKGTLVPSLIGDSSKVRVGNWAIAIGAPLGLEQSFTVGVVSAIQRGGLDRSGLAYIQTDAAINQGNSGGPLLNIRGEVIGINRMIVSQSGGSDGIGFAIPINEARRVVEELKVNGSVARAWIGAGVDHITDRDLAQFGLKSKQGAIIHQIVKGSPADKAGLQLMDVIVEVEGKPVRTPDELVGLIVNSKIGKRIELKIIRNKNEILTSITPEKKPN